MKKYIILLLTLLFISCSEQKHHSDFVNYNCNIPIIECVLDKDTVNLIVDTGAEYSLVNSNYYRNNASKFRFVNSLETEFHGIGGTNTQVADVVGANTSLGYITFIEQDLSTVVKSLPQYDIVGLIGSDFLKSRNYIIDYKMRKLYPYHQLDSIYGKSNN